MMSNILEVTESAYYPAFVKMCADVTMGELEVYICEYIRQNVMSLYLCQDVWGCHHGRVVSIQFCVHTYVFGTV